MSQLQQPKHLVQGKQEFPARWESSIAGDRADGGLETSILALLLLIAFSDMCLCCFYYTFHLRRGRASRSRVMVRAGHMNSLRPLCPFSLQNAFLHGTLFRFTTIQLGGYNFLICRKGMCPEQGVTRLGSGAESLPGLDPEVSPPTAQSGLRTPACPKQVLGEG